MRAPSRVHQACAERPPHLGGVSRQRVDKGGFAAFILNIRLRLAGRRAPVDAAGGRHCTDCSGVHQTANRAAERPSHARRTCDRCRNTSHRRLMDSPGGSTGGDSWGLERHCTTGRSVGQHLVGNYGRGLSAARTWQVVRGCPTVWMEADRASRSKELALSHLLEYSFLAQGVSNGHDLVHA